jgi:hypothetical protein
MAILRFLAGFIPALGKLLDLLQGKVMREAGRNEAILEQRKATDAVIDDALAARRDQQRINADPDSLREPDKYSRD